MTSLFRQPVRYINVTSGCRYAGRCDRTVADARRTERRASRRSSPGAAPRGAPPPPGATPQRGAEPAGPLPENRLYFADYREVKGAKWPFRIRRAVGGNTIEETTFDRINVNVKIDPKKFEAPK